MLPFANISGDPEQDYFVDGVTESLTTDLSRISGAFVIGRSTAFTYKGKAVDLQADRARAQRALRARRKRAARGKPYARQRAADRSGDRQALWAERFDKPLADLFDMQDEIVSRLANQLNAELIAAEARRAEQAPNPNSMDFYFQGQALLNRGFAPEMLAKARGFLSARLKWIPAISTRSSASPASTCWSASAT